MQSISFISCFGYFATQAVAMSTLFTLNTTQLRGQTSRPGGTSYGKDGCRCVGVDNMKGYYAATLDYYHVEYPLEAGASCGAWEKSVHPKCQASPPPRWCSQEWCYVDPCSCNLETLPKQTYTDIDFQGKKAYWSYATCGFTDFWSAKDKKACVNQMNSADCAKHSDCAWNGKQCGGKEVVNSCAGTKQNDPSVYGKDDCRCVGLGGKDSGFALMNINDTHTVEYDPNVGATCGAWEMHGHPECKKGGAMPSWCSQKWCIVDPCKCKTSTPPRTVMEANQYMRFQGKTAYWSYEACGSTDTWSTAHAEKYCVTQKTEAECSKMSSKCAWDGKQCLGKALVELCDKQEKTGVLGMEEPLAQDEESGALSFKPLMPFGMALMGITLF